MRLRELSIRNFRGIRSLDWAIPDKAIVCLAGRGDSSKSTILEALRRLFHPYWNLTFDDADFHQCDPENEISIKATLGSLPDSFKDLEKYGHLLVGWDAAASVRHDDPGLGFEDALRVRLTVNRDLEPKWTVYKNDIDDGIAFKASDREKVGVSLIGAAMDRHLTWSRGSILSQLTEADDITSSLAGAARAAKTALEARRQEDLGEFDAVAGIAQETARALGVNVSSTYKAHLDTDAINVRIAGLALHDGAMPLRQLGLGSKRMLTTGLQKQAQRAPHITLFDEVESGLEPHRIARLLKHLSADVSGQYFLTTHSPVVLRELTVHDLHIVHRHEGQVNIVAAAKPGLADSIQGKIRSFAEAFLAPKILVCEGATEVGLLRGMDDHWMANGDRESLAYRGVAAIDAGGASKIKAIAEELKALGYDVSVLADSDEPLQFSDAHAAQLRAAGITVVKWDGGLSLEERMFADLPWAGVIASFHAARQLVGEDRRIVDQVGTAYGQGFERNYAVWGETERLRVALGKAAKVSEWFKSQSRGQIWVAAISPQLGEAAMANTDTVQKLNLLRAWVDNV